LRLIRQQMTTSLHALACDRRGNVAMMFGLAAGVLFGMGALAVDAGNLYVVRSQLQGAADAAILAAASELPDVDAARARALEYAEKNLPAEHHGAVLSAADIEFGQWEPDSQSLDTSAQTASAMAITLRRAESNGNPAETFFARILGFDSVDVTARAVAQSATSDACFFALHPDASAAVRLETDAQVTLQNCGLEVNSSASDALLQETGACITATSVGVVGNYTGSCYTPTPTGIAPFEDPLAGLPAPTYGSCDHDDEVLLEEGGTYTLTPGVYCGGIRVGEEATVTLQSGLYVVTGTGFKLEEGASASADEVTFYLTDGTGGWGTVLLEDDTTLDLTAPTSGTYAGIAFFQDRATPSTERFLVEDVSLAFVDGSVYVPSVHFWLETEGSIEVTGVVVADKMTYETDATVQRSGDPVAVASSGARLVR